MFWTEDWGSRARVQFWTMLRVNYLLGLHDLLDYWVNASLLDLRDSDVCRGRVVFDDASSTRVGASGRF